MLFLARRYDEAITESQRAVEMDPEYYFAYNVLTNSYRLKGDDDHAFEAFVHKRTLEGEAGRDKFMENNLCQIGLAGNFRATT